MKRGRSEAWYTSATACPRRNEFRFRLSWRQEASLKSLPERFQSNGASPGAAQTRDNLHLACRSGPVFRCKPVHFSASRGICATCIPPQPRRVTLAGRARYVSLIGAGLVMPMSLVTAARGESRACNRGRVRVLPLHRQPVCDQSGGRAITKFEESSLLNVVLDERAVGNAQRCPIASFDPGPITTASGSAKSRGHQLRAAIPPWGNGSWLFARTTVRVWLGRRATRPYFFA
jgi:hypothetical protein